MKPVVFQKKIKVIFYFVSATVLIVNSLQAFPKSATEILVSPDKEVRITIGIQDKTPVYSVWFNQHQIINTSSLGLELELPFNGGFTLISKEKGKADNTWQPVYGEFSELPDKYNSLIIKLREIGKPNRLLNIEFRAYNEGFTFRYLLPDQPAKNLWVIKKELSEFRFIDSAEGFPIYYGEATFSKVSVPVKDIKSGALYPLTINTQAGYVSITEAFAENYPRLRFGKTKDGYIVTNIYGEAKVSAPFSTPWRVLILGKDEGNLIEHEYLVLNLNPSHKLKDVSWIKPGKTISNEGTFPLQTPELKKLIDFASENGFKYLQLDWGWYGTEVKWTSEQMESYRKFMPAKMVNTGWEENAKADPFKVAKGYVPYSWLEKYNFQTFVDLDLTELISYGKEKGVGVCLYIEAGNTLRAHNIDSLFSLYEKWGVAGIKPGFVRYGSQENTEWIRNMVKIAADHKLWVCIHDNHVPDGLERTYPNLFSVEGGGGAEGNHPVIQDVMLPFTRCLAGPFDYTPFIYKAKFTNAHMMGFLVVYYNPAHVIRGGYLAWNGTGSHGKGGEELEFLKRLPASWDESRVLKARIGEYLVTARKNGSSWYLGSITGDNAQDLEINLDFLDPNKKYKATLFIDDPAANTPRIFPAKKQVTSVLSTDKLKLTMAKAGGCAIIFDEIRN